ncbi:GNAT family N-acetyltransferase [Scandinavium manionii]|uniref:GNAT family N-acetyltransferase n=1 Tax=Scandinavium manionii TaxID=2926520 RepID=UPI0035B231D7
MNFIELHNQNKPLLIANVWDAGSAIAAQQAGYQALGTSSAAIAATLFVSAPFRRAGIGRKLMGFIASRAQERGCF